jgi:peptide/nickel transport system permease protein
MTAEAPATELPLARAEAGGYPWRLLRQQWLGLLGGAITALMVALAVLGPYVTPYDPNETSTAVLKAPGGSHWFGTDEFGRDTFSRVLAGARTSISVPLAAMVLGVAAATLLGMLSAYGGGPLDLALQRVMDTFLSLPTLILAMFFVAIFGADAKNLVIVLSIAVVPPVQRVARASALAVLQQPYVEAARAVGAGPWRLLAYHVLRNIATPIVVISTTGVGALILAQAGLGFLGLGVTPPTAEWGQMLSLARPRALDAPWLALFPGGAISLAVLGFNLLGDTLRDAWDPRLRSRLEGS